MNKYSIVIPVFNEEATIERLYESLRKELDGYDYEILFVNDGSSDGTFNKIEELHDADQRVACISFDRNYGQHSALLAGFLAAQGDYIISMDADLRNDPDDVLKFIETISGGYDVVKGRRVRRDATFSRKFFSAIANWFFRILVSKDVKDYGCSFAAFKRSLLDNIDGDNETELVKYIHFYCLKRAERYCEIEISDKVRGGVKSKYNFIMLFKLFLHTLKVLTFPRKGIPLADFYTVEKVVR